MDDQSTVCCICLENLDGSNYGTSDHPDDARSKCCIKCIVELVRTTGTGLISREPIVSYTIYNKDGEAIQKINIHNEENTQSISAVNERWSRKKKILMIHILSVCATIFASGVLFYFLGEKTASFTLIAFSLIVIFIGLIASCVFDCIISNMN